MKLTSLYERLMMNEITSGTSESFMFLFCLLDDRITLPTLVCLRFCRRKVLSTTETTVTPAGRIWRFLTCRLDPFRNGPFHWT